MRCSRAQMSKGRARTAVCRISDSRDAAWEPLHHAGLGTTTPCQLSKILQREKKRHRVYLVLVVVVRVGRVRARLRIPLSCGAAQEEVVIVVDRPRWVALLCVRCAGVLVSDPSMFAIAALFCAILGLGETLLD